ncbi:MAG: thioether cross-link-forming SCIFF peptide maturase [Eubacteriaceae bacterium]
MVHAFTMNGKNFAVDGNSGSIYVLDDLGYQVLNGMQDLIPFKQLSNSADLTGYSDEEIKEAYNEVRELKKQDFLFSDSSIIEKKIKLKKNDNTLKALCLHVAHNCNLNCEYCFASKGDYNSGQSLMSEDVALTAMDYLVSNSGDKRNIEIDFFGGEPLMNFDVVKAAVAHGKELENKLEKKFYFTITTNGTLLDEEKNDFINEYMDNVVISIDGRREVHDSIRYDKQGKGTYDRIVPLAQKLIKERNKKSYFVRGTYTSKNKEFSKDVMHLASLGFKQISIEPVVGSGSELFIKEDDVDDILNEYEKLAIDYLKCMEKGYDFRFYHFNLDLYDGPCIYKKVASCGAGFEYFAVSPEGNLYPCHQFVGQKEFIMGDVFEGIIKEKLRQSFKGNNIFAKEKCRDCWAKLYCSGGCHANAWYSNGNIYEPNEIACTLQKKRIECAIMIQATINNETSKISNL